MSVQLVMLGYLDLATMEDMSAKLVAAFGLGAERQPVKAPCT